MAKSNKTEPTPENKVLAAVLVDHPINGVHCRVGQLVTLDRELAVSLSGIVDTAESAIAYLQSQGAEKVEFEEAPAATDSE